MVKNELNITEIESIQNPEKNGKTCKIRNFSGKSRRYGNTDYRHLMYQLKRLKGRHN
jgi:hypothetical protein